MVRISLNRIFLIYQNVTEYGGRDEFLVDEFMENVVRCLLFYR
jgi:hypothetical protein